MKKLAFIIVLIILIGAGFLIFRNKGKGGSAAVSPAQDNVSMVDGKQIVEISAKAGYQPRKSSAKAGVPTIVRFKTSGTFDCSSFVVIPSLKVSQNLKTSGITDIDLGVPAAGSVTGSCAMGMYPFEIDFQG